MSKVILNSDSLLICLVGISGSGKSTIADALIKADSRLELSVSATSRVKRENEIEGVDYHFLSIKEFQSKIADDQLFEWEQVHNNYYGTLCKTLNDISISRKDLILDIDIKGAINFQKHFAQNTVLVFITPPSMQELLLRLNKRQQMSATELKTRLETALSELNIFESAFSSFDYLLVNENFEDSLNALKGIIQAERLKLDRIFQGVSQDFSEMRKALASELSKML